MPLQNTTGAFSVGRDCSLVIVHPNAPSGRMDLRQVTDFQSKQMVSKVSSLLLSGKSLTANLPKNWTGTFSIDRGSPDADLLFSGLEQGWFAGGIFPYGTMYQYVAEIGGGTSTFQFTDLVMELTDAGTWRGDAVVKQTLAWEASYRNML